MGASAMIIFVITMTASNNATDIISFWTFGGNDPVIYGTISGSAFAT